MERRCDKTKSENFSCFFSYNCEIKFLIIDMNPSKFYSVMFFRPEDKESNLFYHNHSIWHNNYIDALECYKNTPCIASQLIEADTLEELKAKEQEIIAKYKDFRFLEMLSK